MKISINQVQAAKIYQKQGRVKATAEKKVGITPAHEVRLSKEGREIQAIRQKLASLPDVRADKVEKLRREIEQGTYNVSGKDIAEEMLNRALIDSLLEE